MNKNILIWMLTFILLSSFASADLTDAQAYNSWDNSTLNGVNATDLTDNSHSLRSNGAITGIPGQLLDGVNLTSDVLESTNTAALETNDYTHSIWFFPRVITSGSVVTIGDDGVADNVLTITAGNKLQYTSRNLAAPTSVTIVGATSLVVNTWNHVIISRDNASSQLKMFLNGVLDASGTVNGNANYPGAVEYKYGERAGTFFQGRMDELGYWTRAVTDGSTTIIGNTAGGEVAELYNSGVGFNPFTAPAPTINFTITATDGFDGSALNNLTANLTFGNGSSQIFTNATGNFIQTTVPSNFTTLFNVTLGSTDYFNSTILNQNASVNLVTTLNQSQITFNVFDVLNISVLDANITINAQTNNLSFVWPLRTGNYNATFTKDGFYSKTEEISVSALEISTKNITDVFDTNFTVQAVDFITNGTLNTFNVSIIQGNNLISIFENTSSGLLSFGLMKSLLYNITVLSDGYLTHFNESYNITVNLTAAMHSAFSHSTFIDANTSLGIVNRSVTVTYPNDFQLPLTTDENGTVEWVTILSGIELFGEYNITFNSQDGYDSPQSFLENITAANAPLNTTYVIQPATLNITIRDASDGSLITQSVIVTIVDIGQFNVTTGNLVIVNGSIAAGSYTLYAVSAGFAIGQITFDYDAREVENIDVFLLNSSDPSTGTLSVIVFDEGFNIQLGADVRLLQYFPDVDSFVQVGQCFSNSNGECIFSVQIGTTLYQITASKIFENQLLQGVSSTTGEIFYVDEYALDIHMFPSDLYEAPDLLGFFLDTENETLVGNTSFLTGEFFDIYNVEHEVCIVYYRQDLSQLTSVASTCVNGSSGTVNVFGGFVLNRSNTYIAEFYVLNAGVQQVQFSITYPSLTSFETQFEAYLRYIIIAAILSLLSLSLLMKNLYIFAYGSIPVLIIFIGLIPSWVNWAVVSGWIVLDLALMYLARKQEANLSV